MLTVQFFKGSIKQPKTEGVVRMLVVIISWIYMGIVCLPAGMGILQLLGKVLKKSLKRGGFHYMMTGLAAITVYAEYFSLIGKIGIFAHLVMLLAAIAGILFKRRELLAFVGKLGKKEFFWTGFFYCGIILLFAFFTSRGEFHTDTGIYHGQAIRWYEEFGVVRGLGNLQLHYAYNSAYLAFASIFSMFALLGTSLHTTTGFMEVLLCLYACHGLRGFWRRKRHGADFGRMAILIYLLVIICRSMSPATDFGTMLTAFYVLLRWLEVREKSGDYHDYALLAVLAVFVMTMKLSAVTLLLFALFPAWHLVKQKEWRPIFIYILLGVIILLPFLVRNVIISGWLVYPFAGIDWFNVDWKIPREYLQVDAAQITVWGRNIFDISKIDLPLKEWVPIWWEALERYEKMLLAATAGGGLWAGGQMVRHILRFNRKKTDARVKKDALVRTYALLKKDALVKTDLRADTGANTLLKTDSRADTGTDAWAMAIFYLNLLAGLLVWFAMAPFIRYGLVFILMLPAVAVGEMLSHEYRGPARIAMGVMLAWIGLSLSPYVDHYVTDAGVFVKQNYRQAYYLMPKDYDRPETKVLKMGNTDFYVPADSEFLSYYDFPGSCYGFMLERSTMRGATLADGFKADEIPPLSDYR